MPPSGTGNDDAKGDMSMHTKLASLGNLLALCLMLGILLVLPPARAQDELGIAKTCTNTEKIQFFNKDSGFTLEAHCQGKITWTVTLLGDLIIDDFTFLTLTLESADGTIVDASIAISADDALAQRELRLGTKNNDKMTITFKR